MYHRSVIRASNREIFFRGSRPRACARPWHGPRRDTASGTVFSVAVPKCGPPRAHQSGRGPTNGVVFLPASAKRVTIWQAGKFPSRVSSWPRCSTRTNRISRDPIPGNLRRFAGGPRWRRATPSRYRVRRRQVLPLLWPPSSPCFCCSCSPSAGRSGAILVGE